MAKYDNFSSKDVMHLGRRMGIAATQYLSTCAERLVPGTRRVLEIGPGQGVLARHYVSRHCDYVCYEPNEVLAGALRELGARVRVQAVPPLAEEDGAYDVAFAAHVIEHMPDPDSAYRLMAGMARAVRSGGAVVLAAPDYNHWGPLFYDCDYTHCFPVTPNRMRQMMVDAGLSLAKIEHRYGALGGVTGWCADRAVRAVAWPLRRMGGGMRVLKAMMLFRPVLVAIGVRP